MIPCLTRPAVFAILLLAAAPVGACSGAPPATCAAAPRCPAPEALCHPVAWSLPRSARDPAEPSVRAMVRVLAMPAVAMARAVPIRAERDQLMGIAQRSPFAAHLLWLFANGSADGNLNPLGGELFSAQRVTAAALRSALDDPDDHERFVARSEPLPPGVAVTRLRWRGERVGTRLRLTIEAADLAEDGRSLPPPHPPIEVWADGGESPRIATWSMRS